MKLSKYFSLEELTASDTAVRVGIDNTPGAATVEQLTKTANKLDTVRELLNHPVTVTSGFRSIRLNRAIGSKDSSQHVKGEAVDIKCHGFGTPRQVVEAIKNSDIEFDQLILEFDSWAHISFVDSGNRKQVLVIDKSGTRTYT